jgi:hypothetical protein
MFVLLAGVHVVEVVADDYRVGHFRLFRCGLD